MNLDLFSQRKYLTTPMNGEEEMAIDEVAGVRSSDLDCCDRQWKQVVPGEALWGRTADRNGRRTQV